MAEQDKKKNMILLGVMAVAIIGTLFLVLRDNNKIEITSSLDNLNSMPSNEIKIPVQVESDVFSSDDFQSLKDYSDKSFLLEPRGRQNPFKPFDVIPGVK